ncbi:MAG: response regulator [Candidatus Omnitrophica bacterium]|nr:response regulator [Candidatus Omnitrophota bacterium]
MKKKVLIIDDSEMHQELMSLALNDVGFDDVVTAFCGEDGLKMFEENRVALVVIDTKLPGMNGFEVCRNIRKIGKEDVKIIVLTGVIDEVDAGKARDAGADDYCVKTSDFSYLLKAVKNVFSM